MKLSLNWIRELVELPSGLEETIGKETTMKVAEVEHVLSQPDIYSNIRAALVNEVKPHPDADKLKVVLIDTGDGQEEIVCGAPNVKPGQTVAFASPGAIIDGTVLESAVIRGIKSSGMILSERELGLSTDHSGILVLEDSTKPGTPLSEALGLDDTVIDIDNHAITHRPDLWSHRGMSREFAAMYSVEAPNEISPEIEEIKGDIKVEIKDKDLCSRYVGALITGLKAEPSPWKIRKRLIACGIRPISNIVDITNYVMLEVGEPLHAFDADKVKNNHIIVRRAKNKEVLRTLDGQDRILTDKDLVIADPEKAVALAGVMGGENTEVTDETTSIILEAATFSHVSIRHTRIATGLQSEATNRFEKGLFTELAPIAIKRTIELLKELIPSVEVKALADVNFNEPVIKDVTLTQRNIKRITGTDIPFEKGCSILRELGYKLEQQEETALVSVPFWRVRDTNIEADLIEDIARIYGLDQIIPVLPRMSITPAYESPVNILGKRIRNTLSGCGADEISTYSFAPENTLKAFSFSELDHFELDNPLDSNMKRLRRSLLPGLCDALRRNMATLDNAAIYEIGRIYEKKSLDLEELPSNETVMLTLVMFRKQAESVFQETLRYADTILSSFSIDYELKRSAGIPDLHPERTAIINCNEKEIGNIGELSPEVAESLKIKDRIGVLEINLEILAELQDDIRHEFKPVPRFPSMSREFSMICRDDLDFAEIRDTVLPLSNLIREIRLLTIYTGSPIPEGSKSISFEITLRHDEKTLSDQEANKVQDSVIETLGDTFGITLREG